MSEESIKMEDGGEHNLEPAMSMENLSDTGNPAMHLTTFQSQSFIGPIQIVFFYNQYYQATHQNLLHDPKDGTRCEWKISKYSKDTY